MNRHLSYQQKVKLVVRVMKRLSKQGVTTPSASRLAKECGYTKSWHWYEFLDSLVDKRIIVLGSRPSRSTLHSDCSVYTLPEYAPPKQLELWNGN